MELVPLPNQPGANNYFRLADLMDDSDRLLARVDWRPSANDSFFGRYIYSNRRRNIPGAFGGVVDGTGTSAFGNQTIKTNALVGGWTRILSTTMVNEFRLSWSKADSERCTRRSDSRRRRSDDSRVDHQSGSRRRDSRGSPSTGISAARGSGASDRRTSCRSSSTRTSSSSSTRCPGCAATMPSSSAETSWRRWPTSTWTSRRRVAPCASETRLTGQPDGADYLLGYVSDFQLSNVWVVEQRHWATMFFVQDDWKVRRAVAEPRPALRLHHARL